MEAFCFRSLITICASAFSLNAFAQFPGEEGQDPWQFRPNDPKYENMWQVFSHLPNEENSSLGRWDREHGPGMHVDRAWQLHRGNPSMLIAILDSGIKWKEDDLLERHYLNRGELPMPEGASDYDANGDGRFSVSDYANDPRVSDVNHNGKIDPQDLIMIFSNGIDDDHNSFVDDIAGWDFHENDHDPADRTNFGHGTGEAKDSVAALNNFIGGAGACGNCSVMFLRLNDSFIVDANAFARAVIYATDQGARVIQQALGSLNSNAYVRDAIDYATARGVIIVGSAADENSYHHNYPSSLEPIIYTNAVRYDGSTPEKSSTFVNFNNCSNYGARVDVAASGRSCSSEATGQLSGIVGLAKSYAESLNRDIDPLQMISLLKLTADDIDFSDEPEDHRRHPTFPGWDRMTGYGRVNAFSLLDAIRKERIPPSLRLKSPVWFEVFAQKDKDKKIKFQLDMKGVKGHGMRLRLSARQALGERRGSDNENPMRTLLLYDRLLHAQQRKLDVGIPMELLLPLVQKDSEDPFASAVTFLVELADAESDLTAEQRRTIFFLRADENLMHQNFPKSFDGSGESAGVFADLNHDGAQEYVFADGGGTLHAIEHMGRELKGFPVHMPASIYSDFDHALGKTKRSAAVFAPVAVADIDVDGSLEIVAATLEGQVVVIDALGVTRDGFPFEIPEPHYSDVNQNQILSRGVIASPVLADLDLDGDLDIVVSALNGSIYALNQKGQLLPGYPVALKTPAFKLAKILSSPAVFDLNQDGYLDLVLGSNHMGDDAGYLFAIDGKRRVEQSERIFLDGFPVRIPLLRDKVLPTIGTGIPTSPVIADFDQDGRVEIAVHGFVGKTYLVSAQGRLLGSLDSSVNEFSPVKDDFMLSAFGHPAVFRCENKINITTVGVGRRILTNMLLGGVRFDFQHMVGAWDFKTKKMHSTWPRPHDDMIIGSGVLAADVDADECDELFVPSGGYFLRQFSFLNPNKDRRYFTGGWNFATPSVGDFDGDGFMDIAQTTREGRLFVWRVGETKSNAPLTWSSFKGGGSRKGSYEVQN